MGINSKIEWCTHSFNPWRGCTKVSAGCTNCYAETLSHRNPKTLGVWGDKGTRVVASESYWREPMKWQRAAFMAGERHRVFCASLADVFEDRPELESPRLRLLDLIRQTPNLDWLLLTKRPQNVVPMWAFYDRKDQYFPPNVWIGTSVENKQTANERIPHLLCVPSAVRFLSVEPLLEDLGDLRMEDCWLPEDCYTFADRIGWIIVGGESGHNARPVHPLWVRSIRDQCVNAGVSFFFKQWGEYAPLGKASGLDPDHHYPGRDKRLSVHSGVPMDEPVSVFKIGKKFAGRLLDGRTWDEMPEPTGGA